MILGFFIMTDGSIHFVTSRRNTADGFDKVGTSKRPLGIPLPREIWRHRLESLAVQIRAPDSLGRMMGVANVTVRPHQQEAIDAISTVGGEVVLVAGTGTGKSETWMHNTDSVVILVYSLVALVQSMALRLEKYSITSII